MIVARCLGLSLFQPMILNQEMHLIENPSGDLPPRSVGEKENMKEDDFLENWMPLESLL